MTALNAVMAKSPRIDVRDGEALERALAGIDLSPPDTAEEQLATREAMRTVSIEALLRFEPTSNGVLLTVIGPDGEIITRFVQPTPKGRAFDARDVKAALGRAFGAVIPAVDKWRKANPDQVEAMTEKLAAKPREPTDSGEPANTTDTQQFVEGSSPEPPTTKTPSTAPATSGPDDSATVVEETPARYTTADNKVEFEPSLSAGIWTGFLSLTEPPDNPEFGSERTVRQPGRGVAVSFSSVSMKYPVFDLDVSLRMQPDGDDTDFYIAGDAVYVGAWQVAGRLGVELDSAFRVKVWPGEQASVIMPFGFGAGLRWISGERIALRAGVHAFYLTSPARGFGGGWLTWGRARVKVSEHIFLDVRPTFTVHIIDSGPSSGTDRFRTLEVPMQVGYTW